MDVIALGYMSMDHENKTRVLGVSEEASGPPGGNWLRIIKLDDDFTIAF